VYVLSRRELIVMGLSRRTQREGEKGYKLVDDDVDVDSNRTISVQSID